MNLMLFLNRALTRGVETGLGRTEGWWIRARENGGMIFAIRRYFYVRNVALAAPLLDLKHMD